MSRWLTFYLFLSVPFVFVPTFLVEMRHNGRRFMQAYRTIADQRGAYRVAILLALVDFAVLVWYTFFTDSKRVTDSDKFVVFIGTCALALYMATLAAR